MRLYEINNNITESAVGYKKLKDELWQAISEQAIDESILNEIDAGFIANFVAVAPSLSKIIISNALTKARQEKEQTFKMREVMKKKAADLPTTPQETKLMRDQFKDVFAYGLIAAGTALTTWLAGPGEGAAAGVTGLYYRELIEIIKNKGPEVIISLMKTKANIDIVDELARRFIVKNVAAPGWQDKGVTESKTAKSGIYQTDVYGTSAYHAECKEKDCDWKSPRYDRIKQAQAAAEKHAKTHFDKKQDVKENTNNFNKVVLSEAELLEGFLDSARSYLGSRINDTSQNIKGAVTDLTTAGILIKDIVQNQEYLDKVNVQLYKQDRELIKQIKQISASNPSFAQLYKQFDAKITYLLNLKGYQGFLGRLSLYGFLKYITTLANDLNDSITKTLSNRLDFLINLIPSATMGGFLEFFDTLKGAKKYFFDILTYIKNKLDFFRPTMATTEVSYGGVAEGEMWHHKPASDSRLATKTFTHQGYTIKCMSDSCEIYHGGYKVYSTQGDFSNPSKSQLSRLRGIVTDLMRKKKQQGMAEEVSMPRIRKYTNSQGRERWEVLDAEGRRAQGQGSEGFDDKKLAKDFLIKNYYRLV